jgi:hypothetical protein
MSCNDCETDVFKCHICGKEYKREDFFLKHMKTHNEINNEEKEIIIKSINDEIIDFFNKIGNRNSFCQYDIDILTRFFYHIKPNSSLTFNTGCRYCITLLINTVREYYEKIK